MKEERFIATVEDKYQVQEIADDLKRLGFRIDNVLRLGGIIIGSLNGKRLDQVKIKGVKMVEREMNNRGI
ncbi:hypothetical protein [Longitalea arenae]|uniref:hypothetical protein n=1 Tax=Longitalea arenae TaxID=2812558 RepID=UPI001968334B|nr:hypothetical protein [Longitalea arenae]